MAIQTKEQIFTLLQNHQPELKRLGVHRYGVFGSFVHNEPNEDSDVDILVEFVPGKKNFDNFMTLAFLLEDLFGRKVDLVTLEALSPYIGPHILREVEYAAVGA